MCGLKSISIRKASCKFYCGNIVMLQVQLRQHARRRGEDQREADAVGKAWPLAVDQRRADSPDHQPSDAVIAGSRSMMRNKSRPMLMKPF